MAVMNVDSLCLSVDGVGRDLSSTLQAIGQSVLS
jgi:predicted small secreted protein